MELGLAGRTAIVTGGSRGIGRSIVDAFLAEGMSVLAVARPSDELDAMTGAHTFACDLADPHAVAGIAPAALDALGHVDVVVNNAGGSRKGPFAELSLEDWTWHLNLNVTAAAVLTRSLAGHFIERRSGKVVNIASTTAIRGVPDMVAYCTVKGALLQFTRALAVEWGRHNIQVNAIGPGAFETRAQERLLRGPAEAVQARLDRIPDGRMGRPSEAAALACLLASPLSDHTTGALYMVDGGETVQL